MPKYFEYVFLLLTFVIGTTVGLYSATNFVPTNEKISESQIARTVQDAVIAKIQEEYKLTKIDDDELEEFKKEIEEIKERVDAENSMITVSASETKLASSAEMVIKKIYTLCGHSEINRMKIPMELVNYTEDDVKEKYPGWSIEKFGSDEMVISKEIEANCSNHYVIKESEGKIAVFEEITNDKMNFVENTEIDMSLFSAEDIDKFKKGIKVYGKEEVSSLIEDYTS